MDLNWLVARWILVLGRLAGHDPSPQERAEEQALCRRLARREKVPADDLEFAYSAAISAWWGGIMASMVLVLLGLFLEDVHPSFDVVALVGLLTMGVALTLVFLCSLRNWMLDRADPQTLTGRIAARLSCPRAYDFWLASAASVWPALWGSGMV
ncbi:MULTISPECIES: hypothetical protein [Streptomyces]|uniref:hypothetical protein n=1 Tax=Streptomyces TaxID=1883 RepID=UPI0004C807A8|nr:MULTISPECIES: hypothetical protein [Streptomyces]MBD3545643.1 hypothetical protein [Streptomyces sp. JV180]